MQAIGDRLREARMRQKIDIAEVETATKIRAKYLRALENEEFGLLPGSTFVKSFLRTYAQYLGLDPHLLVEEYRAQHEPREEQAELQPFATQPPRGRERRVAGGPPGPWLLVAGAVVLVLGVLAVLGLTAGEDDDSGSSGSEERSGDREEGERDGGRERASRPEVVRLRVVPTGATYVCIDDGKGNVRFEGTIAEGRSFRGRRVRILLGRRAVEMTANGRRVPIEPGADPVAYDFSGGRRRELPLSRAPCA
jgi:transcriptional regulator with XRE-family HTH domain